jgi:hypothetical protein
MKVLVLILAFNLLLFARTTSASTISTVDILAMPAANRAGLIAQKKDPRFYREAHQLAFSVNQSMSMRWKAVSALAEIRGFEATSDLIKASQQKEWFMKNAAMMSLKKVNPKAAKEVALRLLSDPALVVRSSAVDVLGDQMDLETRIRLWQELEANYNFVRGQSLWIRPKIVSALAVTPRDSEKNRFAKALQDSDTRMHESAIRGLENLTGAGLVKNKMDRKKAVALWTQKLQQSPEN